MLEENKQFSINIYRYIVVILGLIVVSLSLVLVYKYVLERRIPNSILELAPTTEETVEEVILPVNIKIPKINVNAVIEPVGVTIDGAMDAPKGADVVGWFSYGVSPGNIGSAVLAGHSGWKGDAVAVFDDLHELEQGDQIYIENNKGEEIVFLITKIRTYTPDENSVEVFSSDDGKAHLNLVTCSGLWSKADKNHPDRLVVFAEREL